MLRSYVIAKIQGLTVTDASVDYVGSVTIDSELLGAVGMEPYERVHIVNLNTGARWVTYVIPGEAGIFTLNGGGARLGVPNDRCVAMAFAQAERAPGATVVYCDTRNQMTQRIRYPADTPGPFH